MLCSSQAEHGSLPRPGVSSDADQLLELVNKLAAAKGGDAKVEVDEVLIRKFASGTLDALYTPPQAVSVCLQCSCLATTVSSVSSFAVSVLVVWPLQRSATTTTSVPVSW